MLNFPNDKTGGVCRVLLSARRDTLVKYYEQISRNYFSSIFKLLTFYSKAAATSDITVRASLNPSASLGRTGISITAK